MNQKLSGVAVIVCVLFIAGCATPARVDQMAVSGQPSQRVAPTPLRNNIAVGDVTGGKDTNSMWVSNVGGNEFSLALEESLRNVGLLAANRQAGRFTLTAQLRSLDQPMFGLDMTVTASVNYVVVERASGKEIFQRTVAIPYTAKMGDAFIGVERLKLANEGAIRTNISQLIDELFMLKIDGVALQTPAAGSTLSSEEKLKELKRLNDAGLITKEVYLEQQKAVLQKDSLPK